MTRRMERIDVLLRREISAIVSTELKDPRLSPVISLTAVETSPDLSRASIYVSVMCKQAEKDDTLKGLKAASGFIRRTLRNRLTLRSIPAIDFHIDQSIEEGARLLRLIDNVAPGPETGEAS